MNYASRHETRARSRLTVRALALRLHGEGRWKSGEKIAPRDVCIVLLVCGRQFRSVGFVGHLDPW